MIKANELRIGNLVCGKFLDGTKEIVVVKAVDEDGINYEMRGEFDMFITHDLVFENPDTDQKEMYPIPLTEEWLLNFGFSKESYIIYKKENLRVDWHSNLPMIRYKGEDDSYEKKLFELRPVKFVHELQNLYFCLTGEELVQNDR